MEHIPHDDLVAKINTYTQLARERDLTPEEALEREACRQEYLSRIRRSMRGQLEGLEYTGDK